MNRIDENMFDELMRQKLGDYQEEPDMKLLANIHARKSRVMRFYGISKLIILLGILGLGLLAGYFVFNNYSLNAPERANQGSVDLSYQTSSATTEQVRQSESLNSDRNIIHADQSASANATLSVQNNNQVSNSPAQNKSQASTHKGTSAFTNKANTAVQSKPTTTTGNNKLNANSGKNNLSKEVKEPKQTTNRNVNEAVKPASSEQKITDEPQVKPAEKGKDAVSKDEETSKDASKEEVKQADETASKEEASKDEEKGKGKEDKTVACHAKFDYFSNYDGGFKFVNMSEMDVTSTVKWDFGDGRYSEEQTPSHKFSKSGVYTVVLQVINKQNKCESFYEKEIRYVANSNKIYPYIKGVVTSSGSSAKQHTVKLLTLDLNSGKYIFYQSASTNNSGEYEFIDVKAGVYKIVADAKTNNEITTYFGNTTEAEEASEINLFDEDTDELLGYNINLKENETTAQQGDGRIWDTTTNGGLIVLDGNNMPVANVSTDASGRIIGAEGLPPGDYKVVDKTTGMIKGGLNVPSSGQANITPPSNGPGGSSQKVTISPNPASSEVKFMVSGPQASDQVVVVLVSSGGAEILRRTYSSSTGAEMYQFDVSGFPAGVYYVIVTKDGQTTSTRLVKSLDK